MWYNISNNRMMAVKLLKLTADRIAAMSEKQQISNNVEQVTKRIRDYNKEKDLAILEKLRDLCIDKNMEVEVAKMYRNIGLYHFYANNLSNAIISLHLAVDLLKKEECTSLLIEYYSELGLVYFYNREYLYAERYYQEAEELIIEDQNIVKSVLYFHYYRYGILLSNMQEYELSKLKLEKSLLFSDEKIDVGMTTMNIGLLYKRQKDFKTALRYYSKALCLLDKSDYKAKSIVYNNISDVYKILGQYDKALKYIDKAFKCVTENDLDRTFVYFNTYTEIKILMGERESVLDEFLELLVKVKDFHLYKGLIIEGISNMIVIGSEDGNILRRLENAIIGLVESNKCNNKEYIKELKMCLGNIRQCLKELKN